MKQIIVSKTIKRMSSKELKYLKCYFCKVQKNYKTFYKFQSLGNIDKVNLIEINYICLQCTRNIQFSSGAFSTRKEITRESLDYIGQI